MYPVVKNESRALLWLDFGLFSKENGVYLEGCFLLEYLMLISDYLLIAF